MMARTNVQFRADDTAEAALTVRARPEESPGMVAMRDLARYWRLVENELRTVTLTVGEACLICDAVKGWCHDDVGVGSPAYLAAEVEDAIKYDGLAAKWEVDGPALLTRMWGWTYGQRWAVVDATERWWLTDYGDMPHVEQMAAVGLVRPYVGTRCSAGPPGIAATQPPVEGSLDL